MRHFVYTLGIIFFSQGLYANNQRKLDTNFRINKPTSLPRNPWISAAIGYSQGPFSTVNPTIICNFRNIPNSNRSLGTLNIHSAWLLNSKSSQSKSTTSLQSNFSIQKSLYTHHRVSYLENYFQQEHCVEFQLPISRKTSIFTGVGIIHTNQYASANNWNYTPSNSINQRTKQPLIGKIQLIKILPNNWRFFTNATFITSDLQKKDNPNALYIQSRNLFKSAFSIMENDGIPWYYSSEWNWNIESAIMITGTAVKIPCIIRASTGNKGSSLGVTTWLPLQLNYLQQIELTYLNGETPLIIGLIGSSKSLKKHSFKNTFHWKASFLWNNHIGIIPQLSFLLNN